MEEGSKDAIVDARNQLLDAYRSGTVEFLAAALALFGAVAAELGIWAAYGGAHHASEGWAILAIGLTSVGALYMLYHAYFWANFSRVALSEYMTAKDPHTPNLLTMEQIQELRNGRSVDVIPVLNRLFRKAMCRNRKTGNPTHQRWMFASLRGPAMTLLGTGGLGSLAAEIYFLGTRQLSSLIISLVIGVVSLTLGLRLWHRDYKDEISTLESSLMEPP